MRSIGLIAAIGVVLAVGVACGDGDGGDVPYAVYEGEPNGDDALLSGELALEDGCLYVEYTDGHYYLAFAEDTAEWDEESSTLTVGDTEANLGDEVYFGGSDLGARIDEIEWVVEPGDDCDSEQIWMSGATMGIGPIG